MPAPGTENFLSYVQQFEIVPQCNQKLSGSATRKGPYPDPASSMFVLKRALRQDGSIVGDIIPLSWLRALVELTPVFGEKADCRLAKELSLEYSMNFWLNKYFTKELYYALTF